MARIRARLVIAFIVIALLPAAPVSCVVRDLIERSFAPQRDASITQALDAGLAESRDRLRAEKDAFVRELARLGEARDSTAPAGLLVIDLPAGDSTLAAANANGAVAQSADGAALLAWARSVGSRAVGVDVAADGDAAGEIGGDADVDAESALGADAVARTLVAGPERVGGSLAAVVTTPNGRALVARALPADVVWRAETLAAARALLEGLRVDRPAVLASYVGPFLIVYAVMLAAAGLAGSLFARRLARPVEALAATTRRVAAGDLRARVAPTGHGEIRDLELAFNAMVARLEAQRKELSRLERTAAWRDMARTLAHEIKNPLTPIQLAIQEMHDRYKGDDERYRRLLEESLRIVTEEVAALRNLVREFSEFARLPEPWRVRCDIAAVLGDVARLYGPERVALNLPAVARAGGGADAGGGRDAFEARADSGPRRDALEAPAGTEQRGGALEALADPDELRRALINLVDNGLAACRAAGAPERVALAAQAPGERGLRITVADAGAGIAADAIDRIFEPHFSTKADGSGLGLAIVEGIVRAHGGAIAVESSPGCGTTFTIDLPVTESLATSDAENEGATPRSSGGSR